EAVRTTEYAPPGIIRPPKLALRLFSAGGGITRSAECKTVMSNVRGRRNRRHYCRVRIAQPQPPNPGLIIVTGFAHVHRARFEQQARLFGTVSGEVLHHQRRSARDMWRCRRGAVERRNTGICNAIIPGDARLRVGTSWKAPPIVIIGMSGTDGAKPLSREST